MVKLEVVLVGFIIFVLGDLSNLEMDLETVRVLSLIWVPAVILACLRLIKNIIEEKRRGIFRKKSIKFGDGSTVIFGGKQKIIKNFKPKI